MRYLFACGGTAGHINPAISVAAYIREHQPDAQILFAGNPDHMEARLVPKAGFDFTPVKILGFQRRLTLHNIVNNVQAVFYLGTCGGRCRKIIEDFKPDIVIGTGGYVTGPVLRKAAQMGIKTVTQEQNAFPGVTTKLLSKYVDRVLLAVDAAKPYLAPQAKTVLTGNPVREDVLFADRLKARKQLGVGERICLLSFGGSLGAQRVNESIADVVAWHKGEQNIHHIHATGSYGTELFPRLLKEKGVRFEGNPHLDIREYIDDMPQCLAAADLVICRAGAITLSELEAAGRASILIPSPNVAENHQYHNAMVLQNANAAVVMEEKDLTGPKLVELVKQLTADPMRLKTLGKNASSIAVVDSNKRIYDEIMKLLEKEA